MTAATTTIERSGPAIRATLAECAPAECVLFEAEFQLAVARALETFDVAPLDAMLDRWWGVAAIRANPLSEHEQAQVAQAKAGDFTGLLARDEHGKWIRL
ncbi:MAG: DUF6247 family protein [Actinomycetota bacterium]|nr:DUF6247 family protein [Actinomycetota bacterium]